MSHLEIRSRLVESMREYMEHAGGAYDVGHIAACEAILADHLGTVRDAAHLEAALARVRETVLRLNALNKRCGGTLIETSAQAGRCQRRSNANACAIT